jgi:uncharacterized protein with NRDE domain
MCLILFAYNAHPLYSLVLAANRDEFYGRRALPAHFWQAESDTTSATIAAHVPPTDSPRVFAGRDVQAGGAWCGITTTGRFSALTNYRDFHALKDIAPSRGALTATFLFGTMSEDEYARHLEATSAPYNGFNLLFGSFTGAKQKLWCYSNIDNTPKPVAAGIHGLSNAFLNTPWHKVEHGKRLFASVLEQHSSNGSSNRSKTVELTSALLDTMTNPERANDSELPDTGVGVEMERVLSPMFISTEKYGTRCSTVLLVERNGNVTFTERTYATPFTERGEQRAEFQIT